MFLQLDKRKFDSVEVRDDVIEIHVPSTEVDPAIVRKFMREAFGELTDIEMDGIAYVMFRERAKQIIANSIL